VNLLAAIAGIPLRTLRLPADLSAEAPFN